jgi:CrcB protein
MLRSLRTSQRQAEPFRHRIHVALAFMAASLFPCDLTTTLPNPMLKTILAISLGAAGGALLRWLLGTRLNNLFPAIPPGTLAANLIGGYIIGLAIAYFASTPNLAPEWRLLIITGFCGSLTTFSTFSAETFTLIQQGRLGMAAGAIALHVSGSLLMTFAGLFSWHYLSR